VRHILRDVYEIVVRQHAVNVVSYLLFSEVLFSATDMDRDAQRTPCEQKVAVNGDICLHAS